MTRERAYELGYAAGLINHTGSAPFDGDQYAIAWHEGFADGRENAQRAPNPTEAP